MVRFLAEVAKKVKKIIYSTPSNNDNKKYGIYELDISEPPIQSYWTLWGGRYDEYTGTNIVLYIERHLTRVYDIKSLYAQPFTLYLKQKELYAIDCGGALDNYYDGGESDTAFIKSIDANGGTHGIDAAGAKDIEEAYDNGYAAAKKFLNFLDGGDALGINPDRKTVLFNVPKHPWLYPGYTVDASDVSPFLASSLDSMNESPNLIRSVNAPARLELPNFTVKLSDNIAGVSLNQGFAITLHNDDGYFDDDAKWNIFNTPVYLSKATKENPAYEDFKPIRTGYVESTATGFDAFQITVSDKFKSLEEPVCGAIAEDCFPLKLDGAALNKNIPVIYGAVKTKLIKLDESNHYLIAEYVSEILKVYDNGGNEIPYTKIAGNIISSENADSALAIGYPNNKIGNIIADLITRKTNIKYNDSNYNIPEMAEYSISSAPINIMFNSGNLKNAIQKVLKNDAAFFIQQSDGRFTIRKYGETYSAHTVPSWAVTKKPEKNYNSAQENYFSSCNINYGYDGNQYSSYLNSKYENDAESRYQKKVHKSFDTELADAKNAAALSELLSQRYVKLKQTIKIAVGIDTSDFELLDTVIVEPAINGRKFSGLNRFMIKEINQSQDILTLEELE